jgi:hypothetical protein
MTSRKTLVVLLALVLPQIVLAQRAMVRLYASIGEYYSTIYVPPPTNGVDYVLLRGQPLSARISLVNRGNDEDIRLKEEKAAPFRVRVTAVGSGATVADVAAGSSPTLRGPGRVGSGRLPATLKRAEGLQWDVNIPSSLPAGRYRLKVESGLERALEVNNDVIVVEVREVSGLAERVEALRIAATRALADRDFPATDAAARQLLAVHPQSAFGYMLLGDAAAGRQDVAGARAAYVRASEILRGRGDTLYTAIATEHSINETIESLDAKLLALNR